MSITLYKLNYSAPSRGVLMILDILDLKVEMKDVNTVAGEQFNPEFLKLNPLHTVPVLVEGDFIVTESHVIITYLVSKYGGDRTEELYPSDLQTRAIIDQRLFFDNCYLFPMIPEIACDIIKNKSTDVSEQAKAKVLEAYVFLEQYLEKTAFVAGDKLTVADVSCVSNIASLNALVPIPEKYGKVHTWWGKLKETPWHQRVNEPGAKEFALIIKEALERNSS